MQNRCTESDNFKADIHMPIHTNAYNGKVTGGTLVMVYKNSTEHNKAGKALLDAVGKISPGGDYSLSYRTDLYELSTPAAMTLYLEVEFHDTATGANWIIKNTTAIGEAIAKGLCNYFGYTYKSASSTSSKKVLDSQGYVKGKNSDGVLAIKELLMIAKSLGIHSQGMDENGVFGDGTQKAVNILLKKWGYDQNGIAGDNFIKKLTAEIKKKI